jgi:hypothetical protein
LREDQTIAVLAFAAAATVLVRLFSQVRGERPAPIAA